jgi:hypothetical protein
MLIPLKRLGSRLLSSLLLQLIVFSTEQSQSSGQRTLFKAADEAISIITKSSAVDSMAGDNL